MKVIEIKEDYPEKGLCSMEIELTEKERDFYIEYAINDIISKSLEAHEEKFKIEKDIECEE